MFKIIIADAENVWSLNLDMYDFDMLFDVSGMYDNRSK